MGADESKKTFEECYKKYDLLGNYTSDVKFLFCPCLSSLLGKGSWGTVYRCKRTAKPVNIEPLAAKIVKKSSLDERELRYICLHIK